MPLSREGYRIVNAPCRFSGRSACFASMTHAVTKAAETSKQRASTTLPSASSNVTSIAVTICLRMRASRR